MANFFHKITLETFLKRQIKLNKVGLLYNARRKHITTSNISSKLIKKQKRDCTLEDCIQKLNDINELMIKYYLLEKREYGNK